jgi:hypothetical protein
MNSYEQMFHDWLVEAKAVGFVKWFGYTAGEPDSAIEVCPAAETADGKKIFNALRYTPDFVVRFDQMAEMHFASVIGIPPMRRRQILDGLRRWDESLVDVKGMFSPHGDAKYFPAIQKMMRHAKGRSIIKVVPEEWFRWTWCPESVRIGKSGKPLKAWAGCKTAEEFMPF